MPTTEADSEHAKYILETALDMWRSGHLESLAVRKPVIRFVDDDQRAGLQLLDYTYEDEQDVIKPHQNIPVLLSVRNKQGQTFEIHATYQVGVEPNLTVLRSDN